MMNNHVHSALQSIEKEKQNKERNTKALHTHTCTCTIHLGLVLIVMCAIRMVVAFKLRLSGFLPPTLSSPPSIIIIRIYPNVLMHFPLKFLWSQICGVCMGGRGNSHTNTCYICTILSVGTTTFSVQGYRGARLD